MLNVCVLFVIVNVISYREILCYFTYRMWTYRGHRCSLKAKSQLDQIVKLVRPLWVKTRSGISIYQRVTKDGLLNFKWWLSPPAQWVSIITICEEV